MDIMISLGIVFWVVGGMFFFLYVVGRIEHEVAMVHGPFEIFRYIKPLKICVLMLIAGPFIWLVLLGLLISHKLANWIVG